MSEVATRKDIDEVVGLINTFIEKVDVRFNKIEQEISELKESHTRLLNTIDGFIARIDHYETELAARDAQLARLVTWARKVSKKTGIPLENL